MTRTTDDINPEPFQPLGEKVKPPEHDPDSDWVPVPDAKGVERNVVTGKLRTQIPLRPSCK